MESGRTIRARARRPSSAADDPPQPPPPPVRSGLGLFARAGPVHASGAWARRGAQPAAERRARRPPRRRRRTDISCVPKRATLCGAAGAAEIGRGDCTEMGRGAAAGEVATQTGPQLGVPESVMSTDVLSYSQASTASAHDYSGAGAPVRSAVTCIHQDGRT